MTQKSIKARSWQQRRRALIDTLAARIIGLGGVSVIFAIVLIFFYLLWVVAPIFSSPEVKFVSQFTLPEMSDASSVYTAVEESGHLGLRLSSAGELLFFDMEKGLQVSRESIELPGDTVISRVIEINPSGQTLALALDNGGVGFISIQYRVSFVGDQRELTPMIDYPYGESFLELKDINSIAHINVVKSDSKLLLAVLDTDGQLLLQHYEIEEGDELAEPETEAVLEIDGPVDYLLISPGGSWMYLASKNGQIAYYDISDLESVEQVDQMSLTKPGQSLTQLTLLLGGVSLLAADETGLVQQWSLQRDEKNQHRLKEIRDFQASATLAYLLPEKRRKGLVGIDQAGNILLYNTTADRLMLDEKLLDVPALRASLSPRADILLVESVERQYFTYHIENPHPELSWQSLWQEMVYEGYSEPKFIWQSSSADNDFEPKFSLAPLAYGTLKAAFYAMMVAVPLAIMGAIYTAYFMSPRMRGFVKPSIEIMEALPTVILGFLAGLWFAPIVEENLLAILSLSFVFPVGMMAFAWLWQSAPRSIHRLVPDGWYSAVLMPVVILLVWLSFELAPVFEAVLFNGDIKIWLKQELGISYDQRNSLVVGIAMGLAVIPTIFSITEDAIFSVPKQLTTGSLALGATPWQTLTRVVLLTASPGIFSAVMIGLGRAVGETMIVLMATGNTPIMDMSIFEGMRTLSANIAVELPESELDSTHYRILFLAALVLFAVTFIFNTMAEVVRQRLRKRYGSL